MKVQRHGGDRPDRPGCFGQAPAKGIVMLPNDEKELKLAYAFKKIEQYGPGGSSVAPKSATFGYDSDNQFTGINRYSDLTGTTLVAGSSYRYDHQGELTGITAASGSTQYQYAYNYDGTTRLRCIARRGTPLSNCDRFNDRRVSLLPEPLDHRPLECMARRSRPFSRTFGRILALKLWPMNLTAFTQEGSALPPGRIGHALAAATCMDILAPIIQYNQFAIGAVLSFFKSLPCPIRFLNRPCSL